LGDVGSSGGGVAGVRTSRGDSSRGGDSSDGSGAFKATSCVPLSEGSDGSFEVGGVVVVVVVVVGRHCSKKALTEMSGWVIKVCFGGDSLECWRGFIPKPWSMLVDYASSKYLVATRG
jgi:hypothetical protein